MEMFYGMCLNSLYPPKQGKERQLCIEFTEDGRMNNKMRYNGLQKLWAETVGHYTSHNGSPRRLSEIGDMRRGSIGHMPSPRLAPCRRVKIEMDPMESPVRPSAFKSPVYRSEVSPHRAHLSPVPDAFHSPIVSPGVSPLRLDVKGDLLNTPREPVPPSPILMPLPHDIRGVEENVEDPPKTESKVESKVEYVNPAVCNDLN